MDGPQHYRGSEELAGKAREQLEVEDADPAAVAVLIEITAGIP